MIKFENIDVILAGEDKNQSIVQLDNFVSELCEYGKNISALTESQKTFWLNQNLEREINNGGFNQFFVNSSGNFAQETVISLREIGADFTAEILTRAISQFPGKMAPGNREIRITMIEEIEEIANAEWEELDQQFFEYQDNLTELNLNFVKKHKDQF